MSNVEDWKKWEGRTDGKFPLRQWLGGSDHSAVFLTERVGHPEKVAIKLIAADAGADRQLARWRAAAQVSHPHLMRIHDAGRCRIDGESLLYLVMEYAEEDLAQILPQRALAPNEVTDLLPPLLDALSYLHGQGFVHGRVKPSNVHATGDLLKLSTDQITQIVSSTELDSVPRRRDVYDAPETAAGIVSPAGDVWSIGVTLVAALTQNVSFESPSRGVATSRDPDPPDTVPQPFRGIARECLHLDPKRRCSLAEIQARLQPEGRSVAAALEAPPMPEPANRRVPIFVAAIVVLMALVIGLVIFRSRGTKAPAPAPAPAPEPSITTALPVPQNPPDAASAPAPNPPAHEPVAPARKSIAAGGDVLHQVLPEVPQSARNTITGTVRIGVEVEVDSSGKVTSAQFKSAGPSPYFARLAMQAARDWQFTPTASTWVIQFRIKRTSTQASAQRIKR